MIRKFLLSLLAAGAVALTGIGSVAQADDIDIYIDPAAATSGDTPVVIFTLDFRSNLGSTVCQGGACDFLTTKTYTDAAGVEQPFLTLSSGSTSYFNLLRGSLKYVLQQVGSGTRIGLALNHNDGNNCVGPTATKCSNGGYVLIGASALDTQVKRDAFYAKLDAIPVPQGNLAHPYQGKELFFELFRYFSGQGWYNMKNGWTDFSTGNAKNIDDPDDYTPSNPATPLKWDDGIVSGANYVSPVIGACAKLYTVNILFQVSQQDSHSDNAITATAANGGMGGINLQGQNNDFKTVVRWMYDNDVQPNVGGKQNVISYFIVDSTKVNTTTRGYAGAGLGLSAAEPYTLSENPEELVETLSSIFKNILSTSTTFVAPSVAVNVYNRAQVLNDVYIAMFMADENGLPNWPGNVKKFQIGINTTSQEQEIRDANNVFAVAPDGRIKYDALSFWTNPAELPAPPPPPATTELVAGKDGRVVDRGGAGSNVPGYKLSCASTSDQVCSHPYTPGMTNHTGDTSDESKRKLFTEPDTFSNGASTPLRDVNADVGTASALQSVLGASSVGACDSNDSTSPPSACYLLKWARGLLNDGTTVRPWLMGDVLHSRPVAINYGGDPARVYIAAASNDGYMRLIRNSDGVEAWGFMPRAVMPQLATLAANTATSPVHPYLTDGAPAIYIFDDGGDGTISGGDKVYMYFGLRRGGTSYYALDITDPENPQLLWRIEKGAAGSDFAELGQTWSTPRVGRMLFNGSTTDPQPVLIFGGGYDTNKDTHPGHSGYTATGIGSDDNEGNALFVVDAKTGALVWKAVKSGSGSKVFAHADLNDSIPSDVLAVDSDGNGLVDRIYVGDTGGVVWRADMASPDQGDWILTPILSVGRHAAGNSGSLPNDRRFFNAPDYAQSIDDSGAFDAVMIGTGDRENPKDLAVTNWFYMFKDRSVSTSDGTALGVSTLEHDDLADITDCVGSSCTPPATMANGWRLKLECPPSYAALCGEKNLSTAFTLAGTIYFTSYIPAGATTDACNLKEGNGLLYAIRLQDGTPVFGGGKDDRVTELDSSGIPAEVVSLGDGKLLQPDLKIRDTGASSGFKSFWYKKPAQ
ncbi:MAG TPA: PilC/PilY family type IV pilus protein [Acidiferrobacterales bacterium]